MSKRKYLMFFTLVFAIVALFGATEVMAFCDFCNPDPPDLPISVTAGGYTITLQSITKIEAGCYPNDPLDYGATNLPLVTPCYQWDYSVVNEGSTSLTGLNFLAMLTPDCCTDPYVYLDLEASVPDNGKIYPVAVGEPTAYAGRFNESAYTFKITPDSGLMSIVATTDVITTTSGLVASGKKIDATSFEMPGPGCTHSEIPPCEPLPGGVAASVQTCVNNYGKDEDPNDTAHYWFFRANDAKGCIDPEETFYVCTGPCPRTFAAQNLDECWEAPPKLSVNQNHIIASGLQGQKCNDEATNTTHGNSPFYHYETWSGGYYYEACYNYGYGDGSTPGWVHPSNCP